MLNTDKKRGRVFLLWREQKEVKYTQIYASGTFGYSINQRINGKKHEMTELAINTTFYKSFLHGMYCIIHSRFVRCLAEACSVISIQNFRAVKLPLYKFNAMDISNNRYDYELIFPLYLKRRICWREISRKNITTVGETTISSWQMADGNFRCYFVRLEM